MVSAWDFKAAAGKSTQDMGRNFHADDNADRLVGLMRVRCSSTLNQRLDSEHSIHQKDGEGSVVRACVGCNAKYFNKHFAPSSPQVARCLTR